jgi:hypothetical protein
LGAKWNLSVLSSFSTAGDVGAGVAGSVGKAAGPAAAVCEDVVSCGRLGLARATTSLGSWETLELDVSD